jgi:hypothetical protein
VDASGPLAPPPSGPTVNVFMLLVGARGPLAPPPRGPTIDVFCVDGGCYRTFGIASQGPTIDILQQSGSHSHTSKNASQETLYEQNIFLVKNFQVLVLLRTWSDNCQGEISEKLGGEMIYWPHLWVHYLS